MGRNSSRKAAKDEDPADEENRIMQAIGNPEGGVISCLWSDYFTVLESESFFTVPRTDCPDLLLLFSRGHFGVCFSP